jgi:hypothetical protein
MMTKLRMTAPDRNGRIKGWLLVHQQHNTPFRRKVREYRFFLKSDDTSGTRSSTVSPIISFPTRGIGLLRRIEQDEFQIGSSHQGRAARQFAGHGFEHFGIGFFFLIGLPLAHLSRVVLT